MAAGGTRGDDPFYRIARRALGSLAILTGLALVLLPAMNPGLRAADAPVLLMVFAIGAGLLGVDLPYFRPPTGGAK